MLDITEEAFQKLLPLWLTSTRGPSLLAVCVSLMVSTQGLEDEDGLKSGSQRRHFSFKKKGGLSSSCSRPCPIDISKYKTYINFIHTK